MRPLRIALLHYTAPPVVGGVERVLLGQARALAEAGHEVRLLTGRGGPSAGRQLRGGPSVVRLPRIDPRHRDVVAVQRALAAGRVPATFEPLVERLADDLRGAVREIDVLLAHNVCSLDLNLALTTALRRVSSESTFPPLVAWHHDLAWAMPRYRARLHDGAPWDLLRSAWPGVWTVTISEARRSAWLALTGGDADDIVVVPNGVERDPWAAIDPRTRRILGEPGLPPSAILLLAPVRITPRKNLGYAIRVVAAARRRGHDVHLVVSGPPDPHDRGATAHLSELRRLAEDLQVGEAVCFAGAPPGRAPSDRVMRDLFLLADAILLTSIDEGFGLPLLEAAAARLPIFCADLPVLREITGREATFLAPDVEPDRAADVIVRELGRDRAHVLATRLRTSHGWPAVYARHIEPLLVRVVSARPA